MSSIRDQIAARRAATRQTPSVTQTGSAASSALADKTVDSAIRKAAKSGSLDIASLSLSQIPEDVYIDLLGLSPTPLPAVAEVEQTPSLELETSTSGAIHGTLRSFDSVLRIAETGASQSAAFGKVPADEAKKSRTSRYHDPEEVHTFKAGENEIRGLQVEFGAFGGLRLIDLHQNRLSELPDSFADLLRLTSVDLSHNTLPSIPPQLLLLPSLQTLDLSHNAISSISLTHPVAPSDDGLSYGAGFLSTSFSRATKAPTALWPALRVLDLSHNKLTAEALSGLAEAPSAGLPALRVLNLAGNNLEGIADATPWASAVPSLAKLDVSHNPQLRGFTGLPAKVEIIREGCAWGGSLATTSATASTSADASSSSTTDTAVPVSSGPPKPVPSPDATITFRTLPAASFDSEPLAISFDIYLPPSSAPAENKGHPIVIWWHGGGLLQGNKENLPPHFRRLPTHPFPTTASTTPEHVVVISPNYRLAPQAAILDILSDVTAVLEFTQTKLNDQLDKLGHGAHLVDPSRICVSGGSAGGYLALMAGLPVPPSASDETIGGYRGLNSPLPTRTILPAPSFPLGSIKCLAPFYPITDLTHTFWATKTDPVPWWSGSVADTSARPHLNPRDPPVASAVSGGPRSILYPYMLQHALFPSLLFLSQRSVGGRGLDAFRPTHESLSPTHRLRMVVEKPEGISMPPVYMVYGSLDDKIQPLEETTELLKKAGEATGAEVEVEVLQGVDHGYDEEPEVECASFRAWLGKHLF